jgi:hypothetical protein
LTILALGPVTNIATVLRKHPDLGARITRVIAVAGRRPGQRFTTGTSNPNGHRDFNFELDPEGFQVLLDSKVEIVLAPFEISSKIWLTAEDLDRLAASTPTPRGHRPYFLCVGTLEPRPLGAAVDVIGADADQAGLVNFDQAVAQLRKTTFRVSQAVISEIMQKRSR